MAASKLLVYRHKTDLSPSSFSTDRFQEVFLLHIPFGYVRHDYHGLLGDMYFTYLRVARGNYAFKSNANERALPAI